MPVVPPSAQLPTFPAAGLGSELRWPQSRACVLRLRAIPPSRQVLRERTTLSFRPLVTLTFLACLLPSWVKTPFKFQVSAPPYNSHPSTPTCPCLPCSAGLLPRPLSHPANVHASSSELDAECHPSALGVRPPSSLLPSSLPAPAMHTP